MAAITPTLRSQPTPVGGVVKQYYGTGASNQADTLSSVAVGKGASQKLLYVSIHYSGAPTYTGTALTIGIDSGISSSYDLTLASGTNNQQDTVYLPDPDLRLIDGDAIVVAAPAGGAVTASIVICLLET
jgi:hypothetical protein